MMKQKYLSLLMAATALCGCFSEAKAVRSLAELRLESLENPLTSDTQRRSPYQRGYGFSSQGHEFSHHSALEAYEAATPSPLLSQLFEKDPYLELEGHLQSTLKSLRAKSFPQYLQNVKALQTHLDAVRNFLGSAAVWALSRNANDKGFDRFYSYVGTLSAMTHHYAGGDNQFRTNGSTRFIEDLRSSTPFGQLQLTSFQWTEACLAEDYTVVGLLQLYFPYTAGQYKKLVVPAEVADKKDGKTGDGSKSVISKVDSASLASTLD